MLLYCGNSLADEQQTVGGIASASSEGPKNVPLKPSERIQLHVQKQVRPRQGKPDHATQDCLYREVIADQEQVGEPGGLLNEQV